MRLTIAPLRPCTRIVLAAFGSLFLVALLAVPVTERSSQLRQDPHSKIVFKTTHPRRTTMFLPQYLSVRAGRGEVPDVTLRSGQWLGTLIIITLLGVLDYAVFCRLMRRPRRQDLEPDAHPPEEDSGRDRRSSGLSLFP